MTLTAIWIVAILWLLLMLAAANDWRGKK